MDKPLLHVVFGGHVEDTATTEFADADGLDIVGIFPDFASAPTA